MAVRKSVRSQWLRVALALICVGCIRLRCYVLLYINDVDYTATTAAVMMLTSVSCGYSSTSSSLSW